MADDNEHVETDHQTDGEGAQLAAVSLVGDVRDFLLRNVRENGMKKPWGKMSEQEQKLEIERASERAEKLIRDVVDIVAQGEFPVVHAIIDTFQIKDGAVTIKSSGIADDDVLLTLNHAGKKAVKIVVANSDQFDKQRTYVAADPDEPGLPGVKKDLDAADLKEPAAFEDEDDAETFLDEEAEQAQGDAALAVVEHSDQWWGGYNSRMAGHDKPENPFDGRSKDGKEWAAGWTEADGNADAKPIKKGGAENPPHDPDTGEILEEKPGGLKIAGENAGTMKSQADEPAPFDDEVPEEDIAKPEIKPAISSGEEDRGEADPDEEQPDVELNDDERMDIHSEGSKARENGFAPTRCQYPEGSAKADAWLAGYNAEKQREIDAEGSNRDSDFED